MRGYAWQERNGSGIDHERPTTILRKSTWNDASASMRADMERGFGGIRVEMHQGFGAIRTEMADRNAELLKWLLVYGATQTAALAGIIALLR